VKPVDSVSWLNRTPVLPLGAERFHHICSGTEHTLRVRLVACTVIGREYELKDIFFFMANQTMGIQKATAMADSAESAVTPGTGPVKKNRQKSLP
jgi:hypothetical protein